MKKINLMILGTQKGGTTSLYEYIKQHSNIYFSDVKEVTYFRNNDSYKKGEQYLNSHFLNIKDENIVATADVHLLPCAKCPSRVKDYNPKMKFIVMVREPTVRAYSAYNFALKKMWEKETITFEKAFELENSRISSEEYDLLYFYNGLYSQHLTHWSSYFPKENFLIIKDTELSKNSTKVLKRVFDFLNINDESLTIDTSKSHNKASIVKSKFMQKYLINSTSLKKNIGIFLPQKLKVIINGKIIKKLRLWNEVEKDYAKLNDNTQREIKKYFIEDLDKLEKEYGVTFE
jgi:hypothetical protein